MDGWTDFWVGGVEDWGLGWEEDIERESVWGENWERMGREWGRCVCVWVCVRKRTIAKLVIWGNSHSMPSFPASAPRSASSSLRLV